jgi:hypothetical protein
MGVLAADRNLFVAVIDDIENSRVFTLAEDVETVGSLPAASSATSWGLSSIFGVENVDVDVVWRSQYAN